MGQSPSHTTGLTLVLRDQIRVFLTIEAFSEASWALLPMRDVSTENEDSKGLSRAQPLLQPPRITQVSTSLPRGHGSLTAGEACPNGSYFRKQRQQAVPQLPFVGSKDKCQSTVVMKEETAGGLPRKQWAERKTVGCLPRPEHHWLLMWAIECKCPTQSQTTCPHTGTLNPEPGVSSSLNLHFRYAWVIAGIQRFLARPGHVLRML